MLKIAIMTDNPSLPTGMAKVGREIAMALHNAGHEVVYIGWYVNPPQPKQFPFKVLGCENRMFGADVLDKVYRAEQFDILITIGDMWRLDYIGDGRRCHSRRFFQWIAYSAIDGEAIGGGVPKYLQPTYRKPDKVILYTEYGKAALLKSLPDMKDEIGMIYHGVDPNVFFPMTPDQRAQVRKKFGIANHFVFLVVSRNQGRKNIPEIFKAWRQITEDKSLPNARLWPHMNFVSEPMGLPIHQLIETYGFNDMGGKNIMFIDSVANGESGVNLPAESFLNEIYNACDCLVMAGSEGFGLPIIEAMACKLPVISIAHSAGGELCGEGRGLTYKVGYNITGLYMHERPYPDIDDFAAAMRTVYHNKELRDSMIAKAYEFAMKHTWKMKGIEWAKTIEKMEYPLSGEVLLKEVA